MSVHRVRWRHALLDCTEISPNPATVNALGPIDMNYSYVSDLHVSLADE